MRIYCIEFGTGGRANECYINDWLAPRDSETAPWDNSADPRSGFRDPLGVFQKREKKIENLRGYKTDTVCVWDSEIRLQDIGRNGHLFKKY